jgi:catechol 2,3-dioxygenase-like lactoylglutathione lyase family enzyme
MTTDAEPRESAPPTIGFKTVVLDTDDPPGMADFYTRLLGWQIIWSEDDWVTISGGPGTRIAFQLALNYKPPTWPDDTVPQQLHIDFSVDDLPGAAAYAESIGARRIEGPDKSENFLVFLDPSGHPFCLCR